VVLGRFARVIEQRPRALRATQRQRSTNSSADVFVHISSFYALLLGGQLDAAEQLAAERREAQAEDTFVATRCYLTYGPGLVGAGRGRVEAATALLREASALLSAYDNGVRQAVLFDLAIARALAGAAADAEQLLGEAEASRRAPLFMLPGRDRARACVRAAR